MNRFALFLIAIAGCSGGAVEVPTVAPASNVDLFERAQDRIVAKDYKGAMVDLTEVLSARPDHVDALAIRGSLHLEAKEYAAAIADLERAMVLDPTFHLPACDLAWVLATCPDDHLRNGARALQFARIAIEHGDDSWQYGDTLGAALAETGEFSEAIRALTIAIEDAPDENKLELQKRMVSYQARKPWRE